MVKEIKPFAFGLNELYIRFIYPDKEFNEERFIEKVNSIEGVGGSEIVSVSLSQI
ncbi:MAG: hypothetical protein ACPLX8_01690 [Nanopusillaceae archaeon]